MWIKLISPAVTRRPMDSDRKTHMAPPLALLVLGALTPRRHRVTVVDENVQPLDCHDAPDLVGITVKADTFLRAARLAADYRRRGIPVVMGGLHPTACPEESLGTRHVMFIDYSVSQIWQAASVLGHLVGMRNLARLGKRVAYGGEPARLS